jgi:hypothetical protein
LSTSFLHLLLLLCVKYFVTALGPSKNTATVHCRVTGNGSLRTPHVIDTDTFTQVTISAFVVLFFFTFQFFLLSVSFSYHLIVRFYCFSYCAFLFSYLNISSFFPALLSLLFLPSFQPFCIFCLCKVKFISACYEGVWVAVSIAPLILNLGTHGGEWPISRLEVFLLQKYSLVFIE